MADNETNNNDLLVKELQQQLREQIESEMEGIDIQKDQAALEDYLEKTHLDEQLVRFVVLHEAAKEEEENGNSIDAIQNAPIPLLKQMLLADGAKGGHYGRALEIYNEILEASSHAASSDADNGPGSNIFTRLAIAIALEHAVPMSQSNPKEPPPDANIDTHIDPIRRYLNYEMAYLNGELDPSFDTLTSFELRFVIDGNEPDEILAWGRQMMRNYRPDHVLSTKYVAYVKSNIGYGSAKVNQDRDDQQKYQNIFLNGGICGRRAFMGRFVCRAFGIPTTARPSKGHGALVYWHSGGYPLSQWTVELGPRWGKGWTKTIYRSDVDFQSTTQARNDYDNYWKVKRAQWIGDVMEERRVYGNHDEDVKKKKKLLGFWYGLSLKLQTKIIRELRRNRKPRIVPDTNNVVDKQPNIIEQVLATKESPDTKKIAPDQGSTMIIIPAAAYDNRRRNQKDVQDMTCMDSIEGEGEEGVHQLQVYLPAFKPQGVTIMRGGGFKFEPHALCSGRRLQSGGEGKYHDWGFRMAISGPTNNEDNDDGSCPNPTMTVDLPGDVEKMEFLYIPPGTFVMGGECTKDDRFHCLEVPKHEVTLTRGFYLGKYPVTQAQYEAVVGSNPSLSTKDPNCPVDNIGVDDAFGFCTKMVDTIGKDFRLPTEAEWEYACRGGTTDQVGDTKWCCGNDESELGDYAWYKANSGEQSHPVGQKKPNAFGLYDMHGNVVERVSDIYVKDYYEKSPKEDPTGPTPAMQSNLVYKVSVSQAGTYSLVAEVVTANELQTMKLSVNNNTNVITVLEMPYTQGMWQESPAVQIDLTEGENTLNFWRDEPPQNGVAVKKFRLELVE